MNILYYIQNALFNLRQNKVKSIILIISMIFAIAPLIIIFSLEKGTNAILYNQFTSMGLDTIQASSQNNIDLRIFRYKKFFKNLSIDADSQYTNIILMYKKLPVLVKSIDGNFFDFNLNYKMLFGDFIRDTDVQLGNQICLLENHVNIPAPYKLPPIINKSISLNGSKYRIVGLYQNLSNLQYQSSYLPQILIPCTSQKLKNAKSLLIKVKDYREIEATAFLLQNIFKRFSKSTTVNLQYDLDSIKTTESILANIKLGLVIGAIVAFFIGGMGLSNIMLISVRDRTSEIGILKAIGAENKIILFQFLIEASFIGLLGGSLGIVVGIIICLITSLIIGVALPITILSVIVSFSAAFLLGVVFGMIPARKAAKMKIVDAIRFD